MTMERAHTPEPEDEEGSLLGWGTPIAQLIDEAKRMGRLLPLKAPRLQSPENGGSILCLLFGNPKPSCDAGRLYRALFSVSFSFCACRLTASCLPWSLSSSRQPNLGSSAAEERAERQRRAEKGLDTPGGDAGRQGSCGALPQFYAGEPMNVDCTDGEADKESVGDLSDGNSANVGTPQRSTCPSVSARGISSSPHVFPRFAVVSASQGLTC